jgi:hypothetical protein
MQFETKPEQCVAQKKKTGVTHPTTGSHDAEILGRPAGAASRLRLHLLHLPFVARAGAFGV